MSSTPVNAFVLSGGANLGAEQAGMLEALLAAGVTPEVLVGTSIGAANAAFLAAEPTLAHAEELSSLWRRVRPRDVFPISLPRVARTLMRGDPLFSSKPLRSLFERAIRYQRIEDAKALLRIVATDFADGSEAVFESGSVVEAVLASTALPGAFAPHEIGGRLYLDGGLVDHVPLQPAIDAGADVIYVLSVGFPCPPPPNHRSARDVLMHSVGILLSQRVRLGVPHLTEHNPSLRIINIPPICTQVGLRDFSRSAELIRRAREQTTAFLAGLPATEDHAHPHKNGAHQLVGRRPSPSMA